MDTTIKFAKLRGDAKIPSKRQEDAGFDIYACFDDEYIELEPHETKLIPTGIASACDKDYALVLFERGSTGSKGIARRAGIVDSSYRGEIFVGLTNTTDKWLYISKFGKRETMMKVCEVENDEDFFVTDEEIDNGSIVYPYTKAIAQILVLPVPNTTIEEISYEELKNITSERGTGALGSSNK